MTDLRRSCRGKRFGIVMFDFYEQPDELLETVLGLSPSMELCAKLEYRDIRLSQWT